MHLPIVRPGNGTPLPSTHFGYHGGSREPPPFASGSSSKSRMCLRVRPGARVGQGEAMDFLWIGTRPAGRCVAHGSGANGRLRSYARGGGLRIEGPTPVCLRSRLPAAREGISRGLGWVRILASLMAHAGIASPCEPHLIRADRRRPARASAARAIPGNRREISPENYSSLKNHAQRFCQ